MPSPHAQTKTKDKAQPQTKPINRLAWFSTIDPTSAPLYVHPLTLACALPSHPVYGSPSSPPPSKRQKTETKHKDKDEPKQKSCIACAYKILVPDLMLDKEFTSAVPNVRPELCPRSNLKLASDQGLQILLPKEGGRVLCVGDGDLSFGVAIKRMIDASTSTSSSVLCTSYETRETLDKVYGSVVISERVYELGAGGSAFTVDATNLSSTLPSKNKQQQQQEQKLAFDSVVWNFPCTAEKSGQDGQNTEMDANKALVTSFVNKVHEVLLPSSGSIIMTHKTKPPYNQWSIQKLVQGAGIVGGGKFECKGRVVFDRFLFQGYTNRKALDKKSFTAHDAEIYVFERADDGGGGGCEMQGSSDSMSWGERHGGLVEVTEDLLAEIREHYLF